MCKLDDVKIPRRGSLHQLLQHFFYFPRKIVFISDVAELFFSASEVTEGVMGEGKRMGGSSSSR